MSNIFYRYLAEKILDFFEHKVNNPGEKYNIQFERKHPDVSYLVVNLEALAKERNIYVSFEWLEKSFTTFAIKIGGIKVIISSTLDRVTPDFLTTLRNKVGTEDPLFNPTSILFIHDTTLDSIMGGTESLQKKGMPLSFRMLKQDINEKINSSQLTNVNKSIVTFALKKLESQSVGIGTSIFEYEPILKILHDSVNVEMYKEVGLFKDESLAQIIDEGQRQKRLEENHEKYSLVETIQKYGDPAHELEKHFDEKGVEFLSQENWSDQDYKLVKESAENAKEKKPLVYKEELTKKTVEGLHYWEKGDGVTKTKERKRNIIIFNPDQESEVSIDFHFDRFLRKENLKNQLNVVASTSGKKIAMKIQCEIGHSTFCKFQYKEDGVTFIFKVVVVGCNEELLKDIKTNFLLEVKRTEQFIEIVDMKENVIFNPSAVEILKFQLKGGETIQLESLEQQAVLEKIQYDILEDKTNVKFELKLPKTIIPFALSEEVQKTTSISGIKVQKLKREQNVSFMYEDGKLTMGNTYYYLRDRSFEENLKLERVFIETGAFLLTENNGHIDSSKLELPNKVAASYEAFLQYFINLNTLPSLTHWNEELICLAKDYIETVLSIIKGIEDGKILDLTEKNLLKLGTVEVLGGLNEVKFSPFQPLNVAYQLQMLKCIGYEDLPEEILNRLNSKDLLPYVYHNNQIYKPVEQGHSPEWTYYYQYQTSRYNSSVNFVTKLVTEKIKEFTLHFDYLFWENTNAPLRLNLINLGDCREVLQGIFDYYNKILKKGGTIQNLIPIVLFIYGEENSYNSFEEFSFYEDPEEIQRHFGVNLNSEQYSEEDILNSFRDKVHFFKRRLKEQKYEYSHITFYEMNQDTDETHGSYESLETGITVNGLISSVTSVFLGNSYRTGFGSKYLPADRNQLIDLAISYNALSQAGSRQNPFNHKETIVTAFSENDDQQLEKIYQASNWVTFIEPKFDLSFFRKKENKQDNLMIIHYSDQYSSSSSYDAITVTKRSTQYQAIIREFLTEKLTNTKDIDTSNIINLFNSINGDWLLRLIANKTQFPREKLSILSAVKFSLAYFSHPNVVWIPVSLEEVFRVSGAVGLKQKDGLFSSNNLGITGSQSDDLLMIGIENSAKGAKVHYYPIEVKIGNIKEGVIKKAVHQLRTTKMALQSHLINNTFRSKVYRDFLIQLALVSAKKMKLYNVWPEQNWDMVLEGDIRSKLLNDDYNIGGTLKAYINSGAIVTFGKDIHFKSVKSIEDVLLIELPEYDGYHYLTKDVQELKEQIHNGNSDFKVDILLSNNYDVYQENNVAEEQPDYNLQVNQEDDEEISGLRTSKDDDSEQKEDNGKDESPMGILFGHRMSDRRPLNWYPTTTSKIMHINTGIIGTMGTGKTQFTKSLITQLYKKSSLNVRETQIGILIFDYKGDYIKEDFKKATNATVYDLFHLPYNPLALYKGINPKPMLPLHTANGIKETIATAFNLGQVQKAFLRDLIMEAYDRRGIHRANMSTWDNPAPTISDVYNIYLENENHKEDSLSAALKDLAEFEIFSPNTDDTKSLYDLIDGVTVINLSGYDSGIQNLIVGITLDTFYSQMQTKGHSHIQGDFRELTKVILVDEADNFLSKDFISLKKILKEGREFGVGTILSTQFLSHFATGDNDYSQYILTWIVHNVNEIKKKEVQSIFNTESNEEVERIINKIRSLEKHESLVTSVSENKLEFMEDMAFWRLIQE